MILISLLLISSYLPVSVEEYCQSGKSGQPYTLCRAEWEFEQSDKRLNEQWPKSFKAVKAQKSQNAANRLRNEQRQWIKDRDRECNAVAAPTPSTQQGRNLMGCLAKLTDERTVVLRKMTGR